MIIKHLSEHTINKIAAGEVLDRPASAIKELAENAIDAHATFISIRIESGGRNLILIQDDGVGMNKEDLLISYIRHTTSKLDENDITNITTLGFRGEALASIAAVSRMKIRSKAQLDSEDYGWEVDIIAGVEQGAMPSVIKTGTEIEVRDLFFATPARLKFLKSEKSEVQAINETLKKIAIANPGVGFKLYSDNKLILDLPVENKIGNDNVLHRVTKIIGNDFAENSAQIHYLEDAISITGYCSIPTYNKATSSDLYLYVNNRPVKDKILIASVKAAYQDYLAPNRFPVVVIFLNLLSCDVDVNVHPAKVEVRFKDSARIRGLMIKAIRAALEGFGHKSSTLIAQDFLTKVSLDDYRLNNQVIQPIYFETRNQLLDKKAINAPSSTKSFDFGVVEHNPQILNNLKSDSKVDVVLDSNSPPDQPNFRLGAARCQLHNTYVVAQTSTSIVIVDQHAAHERIVYEKLKRDLSHGKIQTQRLLSPMTIEVSDDQADYFVQKAEKLHSLGLIYHIHDHHIIVTEIPAILTQANIAELVRDLAADFEFFGEDLSLSDLIQKTLGTYACHHSIRAGRVMSINEMNALLREMEATIFSGQCNHGRPTYIELQLKDIERLFGRS